MSAEPTIPATGLVGSLQLLYEGLLLRDVLGYAFPGATLLTGVMLLTVECNPWRDAEWPQVIVLILVCYVCGVFLRLLGTQLRVLVISSNHIGWFGDPWELEKGARARWLVNWLWRSRHTDRILDMYKTQLRGDDDGNKLSGKKLSDFTRRESLFLHIAGNLGFAFFLLSVLLLVSLCVISAQQWQAIPYAGKFPRWYFVVGLPLISGALIVGHYIHARAFALLLQAAKELQTP